MLNKHPARPITAEDIQQYDENGVVMLKGMFGLGWIEHLREATEVAMARPGPNAEEYAKRGGRFFGDLDLARRHAAFAEFVHLSPAAEIAGTIMGASKVNFFYDQLLVKEPGTAEPTPWHQDQPYWAVRGWQVASIWLPMDTVSVDSSLKYVAGSHRWGAHNPHNFIDDSPYEGTGLPELPDINANPEQYQILGWDMEPGDCLVFQAMIVHGSAGNSSLQNRRRALATRWTGDDARYAVKPGRVAIPTRDPGLTDGDVMDCADFPMVWRAQS
jgi:ectoine hydroxylase-related dioxygenase (phytanoyl-CoA dioxygenase family)